MQQEGTEIEKSQNKNLKNLSSAGKILGSSRKEKKRTRGNGSNFVCKV